MIKKHEGLRLEAYVCPSGIKTIGYGHSNTSLNKISLSEAETLLREDLTHVENYLNEKNLNINQNQFDALASFAFNVGVGKIENSTLIKTLNANEFEKWVYAGGKKLNGLVKRRKDEAELFNEHYFGYCYFCGWFFDMPQNITKG